MDDEGEWVLSEINAGGNIGAYGFLERHGVSVYPNFIDWLLTR